MSRCNCCNEDGEALHAENERLREALKTWLDLTDDLPNEMWLAQVRSETRAALKAYRGEGGEK